jgi:hypothetical protein
MRDVVSRILDTTFIVGKSLKACLIVSIKVLKSQEAGRLRELRAVFGLLLLHLSLICKGQTTHESIKHSGNLYSDVCSANCYNIWCVPASSEHHMHMLTTCVRAVFGLLVTGLLFFHLSLICKGQTTYESIENSGDLYSDGCSTNCYNAWCAPTPLPYVDFSQSVADADRREPPDIIKMCNPPWADMVL